MHKVKIIDMEAELEDEFEMAIENYLDEHDGNVVSCQYQHTYRPSKYGSTEKRSCMIITNDSPRNTP